MDVAQLSKYHQIIWWDAGMEMFIGICAEIPAMIAQEPTRAECEQSLREIAADIVQFCLLYPTEVMPPLSLAEARQTAIGVWSSVVRR